MISFAITVSDELEELKALTSLLFTHIDLKTNEIVILCDSTKSTIELNEYLNSISNICSINYDKFNSDFAVFKNKINALCSQDYIFQLDADELPNVHLLHNVTTIIIDNKDIELFWIPRENFVEGIKDDHLKKWNMNIDHLNRINFPDYQGRIYKNKPEIYWHRKVHEFIIGAKKQMRMPPRKEWSLMHKKHINKQIISNDYYFKLENNL